MSEILWLVTFADGTTITHAARIAEVSDGCLILRAGESHHIACVYAPGEWAIAERKVAADHKGKEK